MKKAVLACLVVSVGLSSCGSVSSVNTASTLKAQAVTSSTLRYTYFKLLCPPDAKHPYWWNCGFSTLRLYSTGMPGNIIPADLTIQGDQATYAAVGNTVKAALPSSGYTKFAVNNAVFMVDDLDQSLYSATMSLSFKDAVQLKDGSYHFNYAGEVYLQGK